MSEEINSPGPESCTVRDPDQYQAQLAAELRAECETTI